MIAPGTAPAAATVSFMVASAPHESLAPGRELWLYEGKDFVARIEVLD
jgi:hypothetical protein